MSDHDLHSHDVAVRGPEPGQPAMPGRASPDADGRLLTPEILTLAAVVVLGSIMTILDSIA
ncbi:MAG TPA: hypothetical protein DHU96_00640 [Actinobacteria bacterium]|nr:hypothetical protein [Actinomycetota bacterium]